MRKNTPVIQLHYNVYFQGDLLKEQKEGQQGRKWNLKNGFPATCTPMQVCNDQSSRREGEMQFQFKINIS